MGHMPGTADTSTPSTPPSSSSVPPRLLRPHFIEEESLSAPNDTLSGRRPRAEESPASTHRPARHSSSEWIDVDDSPPRKRRSPRLTRPSHDRSYKTPPAIRSRLQQGRSPDFGRFFPRLSRILESSEAASNPRSATRGADRRRHRDTGTSTPGSGSARPCIREGPSTSPTYQRPARHRTGGVSRRTEAVLRVNPSLLSVLTTLTSASDRSSGSNSTVTQRSYDRQIRTEPREQSIRERSRSPNVFDYMMPPAEHDDDDSRSVASSSSVDSSRYQPSDAGSSEAPETPSSRSTFPSPTTTRPHSAAELRGKYEPRHVGNKCSNNSIRSSSRSPQATSRGNVHSNPSVSDVEEDDESRVGSGQATQGRDTHREGGLPSSRSSSRSSRHSMRSHDRLTSQEDAMRQHAAYAVHNSHPSHYVEPVYGQHRSYSGSSGHSAHSGYPHHMAMQQYQWPGVVASGYAVPPVVQHSPEAAATMNNHVGRPDRPPVPDAPDLSQHTFAGYELVARELASTESTVKPMYRTFEYLNHRILLHLQDELSELEEQLRTYDEIIAQTDSCSLFPGQSSPQSIKSSRRAESWSGSDIHLRRTNLLGRIFQKTEQYNRAMASYASFSNASHVVRPNKEQIEAYRGWMADHTPIHELETRFLDHKDDLVLPGQANKVCSNSGPTEARSIFTGFYTPAILAVLLPVLLFSLIPTMSGRVVVSLSLGAAVTAIIFETTKVSETNGMRGWMIYGAAYGVLLVAIGLVLPCQ